MVAFVVALLISFSSNVNRTKILCVEEHEPRIFSPTNPNTIIGPQLAVEEHEPRIFSTDPTQVTI